MFSGMLKNKKSDFKKRELGRECILPISKTYEKKDYIRLNVFNIYRAYNGYVQKILFLNEEQEVYRIEGEYYNNRDRTMVPVLEGDILLLSKYDADSQEYKLVQVDNSFFGGLKELLTGQDKMIIIKHLIDNNLVYIKQEEDKKPQIESSYVQFIIERVEQEKAIVGADVRYSLEQLREVLKRSIVYKQKSYSLEELLSDRKHLENENHELSDVLLIARRSLNYATEIYKVAGKEKLTLDEVKTHACVCEYNYIYNL